MKPSGSRNRPCAIATEVKVTEKLKEQGIDKKEIGREKFLEYAWAWKEEYGGKIINQLKKLGASADWDRERFTMDEGLLQGRSGGIYPSV